MRGPVDKVVAPVFGARDTIRFRKVGPAGNYPKITVPEPLPQGSQRLPGCSRAAPSIAKAAFEYYLKLNFS